MSELAKLFGNNVKNKNGDLVDLAHQCAGKTVGLYFSAHWCGPCRHFTPQLAKFYKNHSQKKNFEVIFVSSDQDEESFDEYYNEMPWLTLDFKNRDKKAELSSKYQVSGIPTLVIINANNGEILHEDATVVIGEEESEKDPSFPWCTSQ